MTTIYLDHQHDDGIDIYHFYSVSRPAIDTFYDIAMPIFQDHIDQYADSVPLFYVLNLSDTGMYPVRYMMNKAVEEIAKKAYHPQHYIAYVTSNPQDNMLINILQQLSTNNLEHTRKVFLPHQVDEAIMWLKETQATFIQAFKVKEK